jgi:hypothetical protein
MKYKFRTVFAMVALLGGNYHRPVTKRNVRTHLSLGVRDANAGNRLCLHNFSDVALSRMRERWRSCYQRLLSCSIKFGAKFGLKLRN